jgi:hypothetical protein
VITYGSIASSNLIVTLRSPESLRILGRRAPAVEPSATARKPTGVLRIERDRAIEVVAGRCNAFFRRLRQSAAQPRIVKINRVGVECVLLCAAAFTNS